jgi:hypothetical protein
MAGKSIAAPIRELSHAMVTSLDNDSGKSKVIQPISRGTPELVATANSSSDDLSSYTSADNRAASATVSTAAHVMTYNANEFPPMNPLRDTITQLEEAQAMLRQSRQYIDETKVESSEMSIETLNLIRKSYEIIGKAIMGALTMKVLSSEVRNKVVLVETVSIESINSLATQLRIEKMKTMELSQAIMKSEQKEKDIELVLQACTMQNIETVHTMSRQYDDLEAHYNLLKTGDSTIATASELAGNAQELAKHLSSTIKELDGLLKESEEKRLMSEENAHSTLAESAYVMEENKQLKQILSSINAEHELKMRELQSLVATEQNRNNEITKENNVLKNRLKELSHAMTQLSQP